MVDNGSQSTAGSEGARKQRTAYNFRRLRLAKGWTQEQCAARGGVSAGYIGKLEAPRIKSSWGPDSEEKWAAIFGVDPYEFHSPFNEASLPGCPQGFLNLPIYSSLSRSVVLSSLHGQSNGPVSVWPTPDVEVQLVLDPQNNAFWVNVDEKTFEPEIKQYSSVLLAKLVHAPKAIRSGRLVLVSGRQGLSLHHVIVGTQYLFVDCVDRSKQFTAAEKKVLSAKFEAYLVLGRYDRS